ncbi:hypothetical protein [Methylobacterium oryzae]|uniref:Protein of unassigned function n=1 Tax=Methylobacterium oryzae CBMB20 TaxID=693986 RepID=A0A089NTZ4_9HYPH|nr:hypothetical protein [Methylobacterium oryzae]AIQ91366.1 protein of unassigned function [Methylobacterium oryzae CBMB20]
MPNTSADFGLVALQAVIAASSYRSVEQAVASLAVISHSDTVRQAGCRPFMRTVRNAARSNQFEERGDVLVVLDHDKGPTDTFL